MPADLKPSMDSSIFRIIVRVIHSSGRSPGLFLSGLSWRILERILDLLPLLAVFFWLQNILLSKGDNDEAEASILWLAGTLLLIFLIQLVAAWKGQRNSFLGGYRIMAGYREQLLDRVHQLPLGVLAEYRTGQLADMMTDDVQRIENIFTHQVVELLTSLLVPLLLFIALLWVDWHLAIGLMAGFPLALLFLQLSRNLFIRVSQAKQDALRYTSGMVVEYVTGLRTLRLFNKAGVWLKRLYLQFDHITRTSIGVEIWGAGPVVLYRLLTELGLVAFLTLAAVQIAGMTPAQDQTELLSLLLFILLAYRMLGPLLEMAEHLAVLRFTVQSEHKLQELYQRAPLSEPGSAEIPRNNDLIVQDLSFGYDNESLILDQLNFRVPENSMTAIVGPSGSGKSTLMSLLARFYDPQQGSVSLGGSDLKALGSEQLYQKVSMVFQQVQLFDGTIADNIRIGRPDASEQQIREACKAAWCDDFISKLPEGYNTRIGEGGSCLSGGERQRLSIARALLKDAPVLLLDEATASVDTETQYHIQRALSRLVQGRTVIMIAHRLSTIRHASQIIVLNQGKIVQRGRHDELLDCDGMYRRLWQAQEGQHQSSAAP